MNKIQSPFWVIVRKEVADHVRSWKFIILIAIIALTCMGSLYTALTNIGAAIKPNDPDGSFLFLKLFTVSDGTLPSFVIFINFLGPLLGIALGFDAINSEQSKGTLSSHPVPTHSSGLPDQRQIRGSLDRYREHVTSPGTSGYGIRANSDRNTADSGRVFTHYSLCGG